MTRESSQGAPRRFQMHYGISADGADYVVADATSPGQDWRGEIVFKTNSRSDAEAKVAELNEPIAGAVVRDYHDGRGPRCVHCGESEPEREWPGGPRVGEF